MSVVDPLLPPLVGSSASPPIPILTADPTTTSPTPTHPNHNMPPTSHTREGATMRVDATDLSSSFPTDSSSPVRPVFSPVASRSIVVGTAIGTDSIVPPVDDSLLSTDSIDEGHTNDVSPHDDDKEASQSSSKPPMIAIVGRTADPFMKENWEEDFELDELDEGQQQEDDTNENPLLLRPIPIVGVGVGVGVPSHVSSNSLHLDLGLIHNNHKLSSPSTEKRRVSNLSTINTNNTQQQQQPLPPPQLSTPIDLPTNEGDEDEEVDFDDFDDDEEDETSLKLPLKHSGISVNGIDEFDTPSPNSQRFQQHHFNAKSSLATDRSGSPSGGFGVGDGGVGDDGGSDLDIDSDEDWDAELLQEEVAEAAAKGCNETELALLRQHQISAKTAEQMKRHTMLQGLDGDTHRNNGIGRSPTPPLGRKQPNNNNHSISLFPSRNVTPDARRRKLPLDDDEHGGLGSAPNDEDIAKGTSGSGAAAATTTTTTTTSHKKKGVSRVPTFQFAPSWNHTLSVSLSGTNSIGAAGFSTVSHGDQIMAQDYTLHPNTSLKQMLAQGQDAIAALLASASITSASSTGAVGGTGGSGSSGGPKHRSSLIRGGGGSGGGNGGGGSKRFNIVMYPTPSQLYSLKTVEGLSGYNEKQLESWLKTIVSKHGPIWRLKSMNLKAEDVLGQITPIVQAELTTTTTNGDQTPNDDIIGQIGRTSIKDILSLALGRVSHLYRQSVTLDQWRLAKSGSSSSSFATSPIDILRSSISTRDGPVRRHISHASRTSIAIPAPSLPAQEAWMLLDGLFAALDPATIGRNVIPTSDLTTCVKLAQSLLHLGGKMWHSAPIFGKMISSAQRLFPIHAVLFQLLELETLAHHDSSKANRLMRIFVQMHTRHATHAAQATAGQAASGTPTSATLAVELCAQSLSSLHLYLASLSPLTTAPLSERGAWDGKDNPSHLHNQWEWLDRACSGDVYTPNPATSQSVAENEKRTWELCGSIDLRIQLLKELYMKLPTISWLKARVAYIIAQHSCTAGMSSVSGMIMPPSISSSNSNGTSSGGGTGGSIVRDAGASVGATGGNASLPGSNFNTGSALSGPTTPFGTGGPLGQEHPTRTAEKWIMEALYILDHLQPCPACQVHGIEPPTINFAPPGPPALQPAANAASTITASAVGVQLPSATQSAISTNNTAAVNGATLSRTHSTSTLTVPLTASNPSVLSSSSSSVASSVAPTAPLATGITMHHTCSGLPVIPMLSALACNALILYGDILLALDKYKYAILAFESALLSYAYRRSSENHTLTRRLVDIATKEDDLDRSILYHSKILSQARLEGNLNLYVFLTQSLSKLEVSSGSFRRSEEVLRDALELLKPFTKNGQTTMSKSQSPFTGGVGGINIELKGPPLPSQPYAGIANWDLTEESNMRFQAHPASEFRSAVLNIYLQLARLYLDGDRIESAITVLEMLMRSRNDSTTSLSSGHHHHPHSSGHSSSDRSALVGSSPPLGSSLVVGGGSGGEGLTRSKLNQVYLLLASAYVKRRMFAKASNLLKAMEEINGVNNGGVIISPQPTTNVTGSGHQVQPSFSQIGSVGINGENRLNTGSSLASGGRASTGRGGSTGGSLVHSPGTAVQTLHTPAASASSFAPFHSPSSVFNGPNGGPISGSASVAHALAHVLDASLLQDFLLLRAKIAFGQGEFSGALHFLDLCFLSAPSSNIVFQSRLALRRGRLWKRVLEDIAGEGATARGMRRRGVADMERQGMVVAAIQTNTTQQNSLALPSAVPPVHTHGSASLSSNSFSSNALVSPVSSVAPSGSLSPAPVPSQQMKYLLLDSSCGAAGGLVLPDPTLAVQSLYEAYNHFQLLDDQPHMSTALGLIVETYLNSVFASVALKDLNLNSPSMLSWLKLAGFETHSHGSSSSTHPFDTFLRTLEELSIEVLEDSFLRTNLIGILGVLLQLSEVKLLQGRWRESTSVFIEVRYAIFELFVTPLQTIQRTVSMSVATRSNESITPMMTSSTPPPPSTFNAAIGKTTPAFQRGLYHILHRLTRLVSAYPIMATPTTPSDQIIPPTAKKPTHDRVDSLDTSSFDSISSSIGGIGPSLSSILSTRFFQLDPTLTPSETQKFAREQLDVVELFQSYVSEVYGEDMVMEVETTPIIGTQMNIMAGGGMNHNNDTKTRTNNKSTTHHHQQPNHANMHTQGNSGKVPKDTNPEPETEPPTACCCTIM